VKKGPSPSKNDALHDYYNVTAITDESGTVVERYGYSGFGDVRFMTAGYADRGESAFEWDLLYKAQFRDPETGYYNYGFRYYVPLLGRWINRDPIEEDGGANLFEYAMNDPVNLNDQLGLLVAGAAAGAIPTAAEMLGAGAAASATTAASTGTATTGAAAVSTAAAGIGAGGVAIVAAAGVAAFATGYLVGHTLIEALDLFEGDTYFPADRTLTERARGLRRLREQCQTLWKHYHVECVKCKKCMKCEEVEANITCWLRLLSQRAQYLKLKCDYATHGFKSPRAARQEAQHLWRYYESLRALHWCFYYYPSCVK